MIRFLLFMSFISGIYSSLFAQKSNDQIRHYYELVNKAELSITDKLYRESLDYYEEASKIKNLFSYDAHNALMCAMETGLYKDAIRYAEILIKKGAPVSFFNQQKFRKLGGSEEWERFLSGANKIKPEINIPLRKKIDSLIILDQKYRGDNLKYGDSISIVDSFIRLEIYNILYQYSYPSEDITGIWMHTDSTFYLSAPLDILLVHAMKYDATGLTPVLLNAVHQGHMHPLKFVRLATHTLDQKYMYSCNGNNQVVYIQVEKEIFTCCCEKEEEINKNRKKIYLESTSELKKKIEFNYKFDKRFKLNVSYSTSYLSYSNDMAKIRKEFAENDQFILVKTLTSNVSYY